MSRSETYCTLIFQQVSPLLCQTPTLPAPRSSPLPAPRAFFVKGKSYRVPLPRIYCEHHDFPSLFGALRSWLLLALPARVPQPPPLSQISQRHRKPVPFTCLPALAHAVPWPGEPPPHPSASLTPALPGGPSLFPSPTPSPRGLGVLSTRCYSYRSQIQP